MKKKLFLGLGTIASVAAPIVAVVSCGDEIIDNKMSWDRGSKELTFNLSADKDKEAGKYSASAFEKYGLDAKGVLKAAQDFETVINQNNVLKLQEGDEVTVNAIVQYKFKNDFTALNGLIAAAPAADKQVLKDYIGDHIKDWETVKREKFVVKFKYHAYTDAEKATLNITHKDVFGGLKTNFYRSLLLGLIKANIVTSTGITDATTLDAKLKTATDAIEAKSLQEDDTALKAVATLAEAKAKMPATLPAIKAAIDAWNKTNRMV